MEKVEAAIGYFPMRTSYFNTSFGAIARSFSLTAERLLNSFEFFAMPFKVFRISNLVTVTSSQEASDTNIHSYRLCEGWKWLDVGVVYQQRDVPAPPGVKFDCDRGGATTGWQRTAPSNWQGFLALCQKHLPILPRKCRTSELSTPKEV